MGVNTVQGNTTQRNIKAIVMMIFFAGRVLAGIESGTFISGDIDMTVRSHAKIQVIIGRKGIGDAHLKNEKNCYN